MLREAQSYVPTDDFLGGVHVEVAKPVELEIPEEVCWGHIARPAALKQFIPHYLVPLLP